MKKLFRIVAKIGTSCVERNMYFIICCLRMSFYSTGRPRNNYKSSKSWLELKEIYSGINFLISSLTRKPKLHATGEKSFFVEPPHSFLLSYCPCAAA